MSNPSFSNIDRWLFELMEGNLTPEQEAQLEAFLLQHPELDLDKDMWEMAKVDQQEFVYPNQRKLERRRPIGLYMSMGFASIAVFLGIGVYTIFGNSVGQFGSDKDLVSATTFNDQSKKASFQRAAQSIKTSLLNTRVSESSKADSKGAAEQEAARKSTYITSGSTETSMLDDQQSPQRIKASNNTLASIDLAEVPRERRSDSNPEVQNQEDDFAANLASEQTLKDSETGSLTKLQTEEPKEIKTNISNKELVSESEPTTYKNTFAKSEYKVSLGSRLNRMGRSIQRMMDNPVALKNMKDPYYHVPGLQAMDVNFGAVGTLLATRVQTVSRAQWLGKENQQLMNQISIDGYSYGMRGGLGFELNHNYYGTGGIQNYNAALIYSPKFSVARNVVVEPSIRFKMGTKKLNSDQIQTGTSVEYERMNVDQFYNDGTTPIGQTLWYKDLGAGLMVNTKWFFVGVQADNLFQHYDNIYSSDLSNPKKAATHFIGTIGTDYESSRENLSVSPYIVYQNQGKLSEGWLGVNFRYHWLTIGGAVSSDLEPAASLGLKFDHFMITYNADYTRSQMLNSSSLSHQVTIRFLSKPSRVGQRLLNQ
jgi:type IX secretion system PorP/SprF family membrane protein